LPGTEEEEAPTSTTFSHVNYAPARIFLAPLPGKKKTSARRVSHAHPLLCFKFCFTLFLLASFYQKHKKISILYSCFYLLAFSLVRMSNPKVEVRTFKQQGGESLKDAWYRISNSHHRCTKKHSTMILLRNFYVGIGTFLILLQEVIFWVLPLLKHAL
jgi:hypothetical protein